MNTNVERNTKDLVARVRAKYEKYPSIVAPVLESIHCISQQFLAALGTDGSLDVTQMIRLRIFRLAGSKRKST